MLRNATHDDIPRLVELGRVMHAESPVYSRMSFDAARLAATIARVIDVGFARVVEADGLVVAGMLALVTPHWFSSDLTACDLALFVDPAHRGGMAACRLLKAYAEWSDGTGAVLVQFGIMTGVDVDKTEGLCNRLGWHRAGVVMER